MYRIGRHAGPSFAEPSVSRHGAPRFCVDPTPKRHALGKSDSQWIADTAERLVRVPGMTLLQPTAFSRTRFTVLHRKSCESDVQPSFQFPLIIRIESFSKSAVCHIFQPSPPKVSRLLRCIRVPRPTHSSAAGALDFLALFLSNLAICGR